MTTDKERIATVETKVDLLATQIDRIENNHLVHIQEAIEALNSKVSYFAGIGAAVIFIIEIWSHLQR